MGCCDKEEKKTNITNTILWIVIGVLGAVVLAVGLGYFLSSMGTSAASQTANSAGSYGGMVGGC